MTQNNSGGESASGLTRQRARDWEARYREARTGWDRGGTSPALERWIAAGELVPCRILVPGCGHGHEVVRLAAAGFDVTGVDIAPSAVSRLQRELHEAGTTASVIQADLLHWEPEAPFEAIYEQTALCALEPHDWQDYARRLHRWLVPGGRLFALFMQTGQEGGPPYHCELTTMRSLFSAEHWVWPGDEPLVVDHPTGLHELGYVLTRR